MNTDTFVFHLIHQAHQAASKAFESEITPTQYVVLKAITEFDGATQIALADNTGIDRSTTADVIRRLEGNGLITASPSQSDRRANVIRLTADGRKALARASEAATRANALLLSLIPESQRKAFLRNLECIGRGPVEVREAA